MENLNKEWKKLLSNVLFHERNKSEYKELNEKFLELYHQDNQFKICNKTSILIALRINLKYRIILLHSFGLNINLIDLQ